MFPPTGKAFPHKSKPARIPTASDIFNELHHFALAEAYVAPCDGVLVAAAPHLDLPRVVGVQVAAARLIELCSVGVLCMLKCEYKHTRNIGR